MEATGRLGDNALFLFDYLLRFLRVALLLGIWRAVLGGRGSVSGLTLDGVLTYTLISAACSELLTCQTGLEFAFFDGSIATRFLRPTEIFVEAASEMLGRVVVSAAFFSLPLLLASPLLGVRLAPAGALAGMLFVVSLALAVSVGLALDYLFIALAIALQVAPYTTGRIRIAVGTLLSGALLPLALFPWGIGSVFAWLPFAAQASAPLQIYIGTGNPLKLIALQCGWSLLLWPLAVWAWKVSRERMVSYGG